MASTSAPAFKLASTQTALAILVPSKLQTEINTLRKIHDKAYKKWEPHINILYPFVESSLLSSAIPVLRAHLSIHPVPPFSAKIDDVGTFEHRRNATVFLKLGEESEEKICELRKRLVDALGRDEKEGTHDGVFRPHLTMGQASLTGGTKERLVEKVRKFVGLEWEVEGLVVLRREATGEMTVVDEIPLRNSGEREDENESQYLDGWRRCYHFNEDLGWNWLSGNKISPPSTEPMNVAIVSYNLMSEPNAPEFPTRMPYLVDAISKSILRTSSLLRVLCLQEVDEEMLPLLLGDSTLQALFPFSTHFPSTFLPSIRNLVTLSTHPFSCYTIQLAERHKTALVISFLDLPIQVANVHLTSGLTNESIETKKRQMETITKFFTEAEALQFKNIFVAGDFNLTTSSKTIETALSRRIITPETAQSIYEVIDLEVWDDPFLALGDDGKGRKDEELYDGEEGATFDRITNPLASMSKVVIDNRPQRYDRILFKRGAHIQLKNFEIFGRPTDDRTCLSDHYGIYATLEIENIREAEICAESITHEKAHLLDSSHEIQIIEDSTDLNPFIEPHLPTKPDRKRRENALSLLQKILSQNKNLSDLILAPLGSYCMDTYFADSDVDVLAIASVSPQVFFDFGPEQLRAHDIGKEGEEGEFKGVHFVNSLVSIIEVNVLGIKFDIQYCQAPELLKRYHTSSKDSLQTLAFDSALLSTLTPTSLRPLNTYRDTAYLLTTLPHISSYRLSHRFLSLYLKCHGLYSAKFGYLGGIHLSLLLNRVVKLISPTKSTTRSTATNTTVSPAMIVRTFFNYYATFDWANEAATDPEIGNEKKVVRGQRDAVFIHALHTPTARPNVASSCTVLSVQIISSQFSLAASKLAQGEWEWCLRSKDKCAKEFLGAYGAYIRIAVDMWDVNEIGGERVREVVGGIESRVVRLMVVLGRIGGVQGRVWPARFHSGGDEAGEEVVEWSGFKGYYLIGISAKDGGDVERKKLLTGKVLTAVREFETTVRQSREIGETSGNVWVGMDLIPKKKVLEMGLVVDGRDWSLGPSSQAPPKPNVEEVDDPTPAQSTLPSRTRIPGSKSLRPAQDIISRIKWDPTFSTDNFLIGYEDRFVGIKETELGKWKSEQTDEEFIPMHRIVWIRKKDKGEDGGGDEGKVWDRRRKVDLVFASGVGKGDSERHPLT